MKTLLRSIVAGAGMLAFAGAATAAEPVALSDTEMDGVTAGFAALAGDRQNLLSGILEIPLFGASAVGDLAADTFSDAFTETSQYNKFAYAENRNTAFAAGATFQTWSAASSRAIASAE